DVSGASGQATLAAAGSGYFSGGTLVNRPLTSTNSSAGGTISIAAVLGAVLEGNLVGRSGGGDAAGGTLSITLTPHSGSGLSLIPIGYWPVAQNSYIVLQSTLQPGD